MEVGGCATVYLTASGWSVVLDQLSAHLFTLSLLGHTHCFASAIGTTARYHALLVAVLVILCPHSVIVGRHTLTHSTGLCATGST